MSVPSLFKKTCPCTILAPLFLIFRFPPLREVIKINSPPPSKKSGRIGGGGPNYDISHLLLLGFYYLNTIFNFILYLF